MTGASERYRIVKLAGGAHSIHSLAEGETFHPVVGPAREAQALYVRQLRLPERARACADEFVIWDVGLGAAANPLTFLRANRGPASSIRIVSFDHTLEPLQFALQNTGYLPYLAGYEGRLATLIERKCVSFDDAGQRVFWEARVADFPRFLKTSEAAELPKPHAIMFDAFSPARNPAMWTAPLFTDLFKLLDAERPCALPTYSRSTMLRVTLLLAGFHVGKGQATGEKEETTMAANAPELIAELLDHRWLARARRSHSAEPMWEPEYRQAPLASGTWERLKSHPQFCAGRPQC